METHDGIGKPKKKFEANMYCSEGEVSVPVVLVVDNHIVGDPWSMDLGRKFELVMACLPPILRVNLA